MAILKSEFSLGNGRLKEVAGLTYDDATGTLATGASSILALGAAGFSISAHTFLGAAITANASFSAGNIDVASKGYVDAAIDAIVPGIPGDATYIDFTVAASAGFGLGQVVAIASTGEPVAADALSATNSNAIGVVIAKPNGTTVRVQVDGRVTTSTNLTAFATGDLTFVSDTTAGSMEAYSGLAADSYAVQVGIVASAAASGIIVLQPRIFGQVG